MVAICADSNRIIRRYVCAILKKYGHTQIEAENGAVALEAFKKANKVDLIITDVDMPELNGLELIKRINGLNQDCPPKILIHSEINIDDLTLQLDKYKLPQNLNSLLIEKPTSVNGLVERIDNLFKVQTKKDARKNQVLC